MGKQTVTVIDIAGIQDYIFNSNNLQHILGASGIVHAATHEWVYEQLSALGNTNVFQDSGGEWQIKPGGEGMTSEVIYTGGGNAVLLFDGAMESCAREFTKAYTWRILNDAPGLQPIIAHTECDPASDSLVLTVQGTFDKVREKKHCRRFSTPMLGMSVTAACDYTGLPAVGIEREDDGTSRRISAEVKAKQAFVKPAEQRLKRVVNLPGGWRFVRDFNEIGSGGKSSYMAVIHMDGNKMGLRLNNLAGKFAIQPQNRDCITQNRDYKTQVREFSNSIEVAAKTALQESIRAVREAVRENKGKLMIGREIDIRKKDDLKLLPVRPIVFGGDDTTIVCDGRLGLTFTEFYLRKLTKIPLSDTNQPMSARAGIAIVKTHHPFARAVDMADNLTKSAKFYIKKCPETVRGEEASISAIDWHFASGGAIEDIEAIRAREYVIQEEGHKRLLNMRPVRLGTPVTGDWHAWDVFKHGIEEFSGPEWAKRRNKIMALRETVRKGPDAVQMLRTLHKLPKLPRVQNNPVAEETGWIDNYCTCFDAIEALDFFTPLGSDGKK